MSVVLSPDPGVPLTACGVPRKIAEVSNKSPQVITRSDPVLEALKHMRGLKQAARRAYARVRFAVLRKRRLKALSERQIGQYRRDGYLLVPSLIPNALVEQAEAAMWECLCADPRDPATWPRLGWYAPVIRDRRILATYTDEMIAAAAQLAGEDVSGFANPTRTLPINNVPVQSEWRIHQPHLDRTMPEMRYRTFPRPYRIGAMTYLSIARRHCGCTIVWPGSHLTVGSLARADPRGLRYLAALGGALARVELGPPLEIEVSPGDVLFHHYLCVHTSSDNLGAAPRLAINHKW